ncbi:TRAP transporter large permease subunit [Neotabrizicola sp. VNH66]|uniref:TRAP transporter large permease subunit n=1 Tax=Neotabrizicola sp. VNH66 TaxID=3400918 RepID=UPI003C10250F
MHHPISGEAADAPRRTAISSLYSHVISALAALGTVWIFAIMLLICADVIGLKLFARPLYGVIEFTENSIVPIVFLQLAAVLRHGRLTRADFLFAPLKANRPGIAGMMDAVFLLIGGGIFAVLAAELLGDFTAALGNGEYIGTRGVFTMPTWPFRLLTAIGAVATAVEFARCVTLALARCRSRQEVLALSVTLGLFALSLALIMWMEPGRLALGGLIILGLVVLLAAGMHVAPVMMLVGLVGIWLIRDNPTIAFKALKTATTGTVNKFDFGVIPLFVLMGLFTDISGIGRDAYRVAAWWTRKLLGGLGIATVVANAIFAAVTGISIASAAVFSKLAVPQMVAHGYTPRFATGTVAGSSVLGMLLPPSLLLIIYAFVAEASVGKLFLAAIIPGLFLALLFCATILLMARYWPGFVGQPASVVDLEAETLVSSARRLLPIGVLITVIIGGVYLGWFTPTQAGAVGALAAMGITILRGKLNRSALWMVMQETGLISVSVLMLVIGASMLSKALVISTLPMQMVDFATASGFGFWGVLGLFLLIVVLMGMFLDASSIIVITVPIALPLIVTLGVPVIGPDVVIWFGIVTVVAVEMGLLTPPFGISVFVVKSTVGSICTLGDVFIGSLPFVLAMAVLIVVLMAFPSLVTLAF